MFNDKRNTAIQPGIFLNLAGKSFVRACRCILSRCTAGMVYELGGASTPCNQASQHITEHINTNTQLPVSDFLATPHYRGWQVLQAVPQYEVIEPCRQGLH
jgi:hypothetical protein